MDGDFIGDILQDNKPEHITRVYFHNLNGLKWDRHGGAWPMVCQAMAGIQADIACFSEINQDTQNYTIREKMTAVAKQQFDHVRLVTASSNRKAKRAYKPGGTAMLTMMETVALSKEQTKDRLGRWVSTRYSCGDNNNMTIIGAYQVCQNQRTGNLTAATQQINQMLEESAHLGIQEKTPPRDAFIRDLTAFIQQRQLCGDKIILGGDFNEEMSENSGVYEMATQCGLVDIFSQRFGTATLPATFKGGSRRLDYILLSPTVAPAIAAMGYEPYDYRGVFSDHRPMYLDLDSQALFGDQPVPLASKSQREFKANDPKAVRTYIEAKYDELEKHNLQERIQCLESLQIADPSFVERFDRDMTRAAIIATKKIKKTWRYPWSPMLSKAWAVLHFYKLHLSQLRNPGISLQASISGWKSRHQGMPSEIPLTEAEAKRLIQDAFKNLQRVCQAASEY
jgi:exonuclease III